MKLRLFLFLFTLVIATASAQEAIPFADIDTAVEVLPDTFPTAILEGLKAHLNSANRLAAPSKKVAAITTHLDSTVTVDQDGKPVSKIIYDWDDLDRNYRTTTYYYTNGVLNGNSQKDEKLFNKTSATTVLTSKYTWNANLAQWIGQSRNETVYDDANHRLSYITYAWIANNYSFWTPISSTTYTYDPTNYSHIVEQITWTIQTATQKLIPQTKTEQAWDERNNLVLKIVYKGGVNAAGEWIGGSGGTKNLYAYQVYGTTSKKVLDESYTWNTASNTWVGKTSGKTIWEYTTKGDKETAKIVFNWNAAALVYDTATATYKEYNTSGLETSSFAYKWTNGVKAGNGNGTRTSYTGTNKDSTLTYQWNDNKWVMTKAVVKILNEKNKPIIAQTLNYNKTTGLLSSGSASYTYYASDGITVIGLTNYKVASNQLIPNDSTATNYSGTTKISEDKYTWDATIPAWRGDSKVVQLTGSNLVSGTLTYGYSNGAWTLTSGAKTVKFTDTQGAVCTISYVCGTDSVWRITSGSKNHTYTDINNASLVLIWTLNSDSTWSFKSGTKTPADRKNELGKTICQCSYYCNGDSIWKVTSYKVWEYDEKGNNTYYAGFKKDSVPEYYTITTYNANNKQLINERYDWSNNIWVGNFRYEYEYDAEGNTIMAIHLSSWQNNTWLAGSKDTYVYDANRRIIEKASYTWGSNIWQPTFKYLTTYDTGGKVVVEIMQKNAGGDWENATKKEYVYSGNIKTKEITYTWQNSDWSITNVQQSQEDPATSETVLLSEVYENGLLTSSGRTSYIQGADGLQLEKTVCTTTYNSDGTPASYTLTTNYYNTEN